VACSGQKLALVGRSPRDRREQNRSGQKCRLTRLVFGQQLLPPISTPRGARWRCARRRRSGASRRSYSGAGGGCDRCQWCSAQINCAFSYAFLGVPDMSVMRITSQTASRSFKCRLFQYAANRKAANRKAAKRTHAGLLTNGGTAQGNIPCWFLSPLTRRRTLCGAR
jgi:hypothetical protein